MTNETINGFQGYEYLDLIISLSFPWLAFSFQLIGHASHA